MRITSGRLTRTQVRLLRALLVTLGVAIIIFTLVATYGAIFGHPAMWLYLAYPLFFAYAGLVAARDLAWGTRGKREVATGTEFWAFNSLSFHWWKCGTAMANELILAQHNPHSSPLPILRVRRLTTPEVVYKDQGPEWDNRGVFLGLPRWTARDGNWTELLIRWR